MWKIDCTVGTIGTVDYFKFAILSTFDVGAQVFSFLV